MEIRSIPGYEGLYSVSDEGLIYSHITNKWLANPPGVNGYHHNVLTKNGHKFTLRIDHAVLLAFVGPKGEGQESLHSDDNKSNNTLGNLRWGTRVENMQDLIRNGRTEGIHAGSNNGMSKLDENKVREIRRLHSERVTISKLSLMFKVNYSTMYFVTSRRTWTHI